MRRHWSHEKSLQIYLKVYGTGYNMVHLTEGDKLMRNIAVRLQSLGGRP